MKYQWERFLCARGYTLSLTDGGYLYVPEEEFYGFYRHEELYRLSDLASTPCAVILGEPGIGKSTILKDLHGVCKLALIESKDVCGAFVSLSSYDEGSRLIREVFGAPELLRWVTGSHNYYLFLDSLDEALIRIDPLSSILVQELNKLPTERLFLRLSCRTGVWPMHLENGLKEIWPSHSGQSESTGIESWKAEYDQNRPNRERAYSKHLESCGIYEVAPLQRKDVELAAKENSIDPSHFLKEIAHHSIVPLAMVPVTLDFLLKEMKVSGKLPAQKWELYEKGCLCLCSENNDQRHTKVLQGKLSAKQRIVVAGYIALQMMLCNKSALYCGRKHKQLDPSVLDMSELEFAAGPGDEDGIAASRDSIEEVLSNTGLFSSRGGEQLGWAHQTYMEFLAAWYIEHIKLPESQLMDLLQGSDQRIVPQLAELSVWVSVQRSSLLRRIVQSDPYVVIMSDHKALDADFARSLVEAFLRKAREDQDYSFSFNFQKSYAILQHDELGSQLSAYIANSGESRLVRRYAIDMASVCGESDVQDALVDVILNASEDIGIRAYAIRELRDLGSKASKRKVVGLLNSKIEMDNEFRLRGPLIELLWPEVVSLGALLPHLVLPSEDSVIDDYHIFLRHKFAKKLKKNDILPLLEWIRHAEPDEATLRRFDSFYGGIILEAFRHLSDDSMRKETAHALLVLCDKNPHFLDEDICGECVSLLDKDVDLRRNLLKEFLLKCGSDSSHHAWFLQSDIKIYRKEDQRWLLEEIANIPRSSREGWSRFARYVYDESQVESLDTLLEMIERFEEVEVSFKFLYKPVMLDSIEAKRGREGCAQGRLARERQMKRTKVLPVSAEKIEDSLAKIEDGEVDWWWQIVRDLTVGAQDGDRVNWWGHDLRRFPGWQCAASSLRSRIINAAKSYLCKHELNLMECIRQQTHSQAEISYYQALALLWHEDKGTLDSLDQECWDNCAGTVLCIWGDSGTDDTNLGAELVKLAFEKAPNSVLRYFEVILKKELQGKQVFVTNKVEACWNDSVSAVVLGLVQNQRYIQSVRGALLRKLLEKGCERAFFYARDLLTTLLKKTAGNKSAGKVEEVMCSHALAGLMMFSDHAEWETLRLLVSSRRKIVNRALEIFASGRFDRGFSSYNEKLSLKQKVILFDELATLYPHLEDPEARGVHFVTSREDIASFRDSLITSIVDTGTQEAVSGLVEIREKFTGLDWLSRSITRARDLARRMSWTPSTPSELKVMLRDPKKRRIEGEYQLLELVYEVLVAFAADLHGPTTKLHRLWDNLDTGRATKPKYETTLSSELKVFLDQELRISGVVVNREVEIHARGGNKKDLPDLSVEMFTRDTLGQPRDRICVLIEVKGNWNKDLLESMRTQLVERYLAKNTCDHGIYAVGFYSCDAWCKEDRHNKPRALALSYGGLEELREKLNDQARELSCGGKTIRAVVLDCSIPTAPDTDKKSTHLKDTKKRE